MPGRDPWGGIGSNIKKITEKKPELRKGEWEIEKPIPVDNKDKEKPKP